MSSFYCEKCGASIVDTPHGYITECEHYPLDPYKARKAWERENALFYQLRRDAASSEGEKK